MNYIIMRDLKYREANKKQYEYLATSDLVLNHIRALEAHIYDNNEANEYIDRDLSRLSFLREKYILLVNSEI